MRTKLDQFHHHEVMDRGSLLAESWERYICEHPAVLLDLELKTKAQEISVLLWDFYQLAGSRSL